MAVSATDVQKAYLAYFGRPADPVGLAYWQTSTAATMKAGFAASAEYAALYAGMNSTQMVAQVYTNLLGRTAEPAGLLYWSGELAAGRQTVSTLVDAMQTNALGADITTIANRVTYATAFTAAVDTTAEIVGYSGTAAADAARTAVSAVVDTAASLTAAQAALATSVATVTAAGAATTGQTYTLTTGVDAITGTSGNDTITAGDIAGAAVWTTGDSVNGGAGTDIFNVISNAAIAVPTAATVTNVETLSLTSGSTITANTTGFTGLTALNTNAGGTGAQTLTAAATTAVAATSAALTAAEAINGGSTVTVINGGVTAAGTLAIGATTAAAGAVSVTSTSSTVDTTVQGTIAVTGGTTISINQIAGNAVNTTTTAGAVTVTGNASTTAVTVTSSTAATASATKVGRVNGVVTIADGNAATASDTITTVTLSNYDNSTVASNVLSTVNLTGATTASGTLALNTTAADTSTRATTLALNMAGGSVGAITGTQADLYTTVNVASSAASTIADESFAAATTLNVSGAGVTTFTANTAMGAVTAINSTGGGLSLGTAIGTGVTFTGGAGAETVSLGATTKTITMGAGNDKVTSAGLVGTGGSVNAGDGTDTIVMTSAQAAVADNDATFNTKFTNFEVLELSDALGANTTLDLAGINAVSKVTLTAGGASTTTSILNNLANGGTVTQTGNGTGVVIQVANALFNAADTLNLVLSKSGVLTTGTVTAAGVETLNISTADAVSTGSTAAIHTATVTAADATSIVVTGNNGLNGTYTGSVAVTNFDASGVVANGTADTAANLAVTYVSVNTTAANAVTIKGGAGNDTLTGAGNVDTITGGEGADTITGGAGNDFIILTETTAAADTVVFADAATNGVDTITGFAAGTGADLAKLVAGSTTNAAQDVAGVADFGTSTNTTLTIGAGAFALTGASSTTGDIVEITATLSSYGNLGLAGATSGTQLLKALSSTDAAATSITATTAGDNFYVVAYQSGNAYLYQVTDDGAANATVTAAELALIGVFNGVAAGAFASGDFTV